ncbi:putative ribonuclease H-like domain-containing protein, partial [Tanacetum coccineum]
QMSTRDKTGLRYGTQINELSSNSKTDSKISLSVFDVRSSDEEITPTNDMSFKVDRFHAVPPPITGNFLTLRADISFAGNEKEVNAEKPKSINESIVSESNVNNEKVINKDWASDDEDEVSDVQTVYHVKSRETQIVKIGQTTQKQVRTNVSTDRSNISTGRPKVNPAMLVSTARPCVSTARPSVSTARQNVSPARLNVYTASTVRPFVLKIAQTGSAIRPIYQRMDNVRPRASSLPINRSYYPKPAYRPNNLKQDVKSIWVQKLTTTRTRAVVNAGNKAYLSDYEDYNGGFVAFGSDPKGGKIIGKGQGMSEAEQALQDELEKMVAQEVVAQAVNDAIRQAFEEEKRKNASSYKANQATSTNSLKDDFDLSPNEGVFSGVYDDDNVGAEADFNNMDNTIDVSPIPTLRIHKVWVLVDLPYGKKVIGTKWVFRNKRDKRSIIRKNKARLVAQGFRHEEGIDYDEVFAPVTRIEAIRLFLDFASYMGFTVYQMDVKSAFLYGTIGEEVYVHQPLGFVDPTHPNKVYKVIKSLYGLHQAPRAWYETLSSFLLENGFRRGTI